MGRVCGDAGILSGFVGGRGRGRRGPGQKAPQIRSRGLTSGGGLAGLQSGRGSSAGLGEVPFLVSPSPGGCLHPDFWPLSVFKASRGRPCLSHIIPVVLALLPCLPPSKGLGAHSGAPGPPRLASGFEGLLTCSLDSPPTHVTEHLHTFQGLARRHLGEMRSEHSSSYCQLKKKKHKLRGVSSVLFGAQMRPAA